MKRGEQLIYTGPLGRKSYELVKYFEAVESIPKIKPGYNPATWMLEVTSPAEESRLGIDFEEIYRQSILFQRNSELVESLSKPHRDSKGLNLPNKVCPNIYSPVSSLSLEAKFVILAKSTIHCSLLLLHCHHLTDAWNNMLEIWGKEVFLPLIMCPSEHHPESSTRDSFTHTSFNLAIMDVMYLFSCLDKMSYTSHPTIVHRDLKSPNLLVLIRTGLLRFAQTVYVSKKI